ncbi:MAG: OpgC domain-containing protein [Paracoccus aminovorans]|nr:OpgC domain-containing protein [Paracoccus aminovorans]
MFFAGVAMGAFRDRIMPVLRRHAALLTVLSVAVMLFSLTTVLAWRIGPPAKPVTDFIRSLTGGIDKWSLDFARLIAILAASWLVAVPLARPFAWMAGTAPGEALAEIGRGGLYSFIVCVLLSIWGDALDMTVAQGGAAWFWLRLAIDLWLIVAFWAIAAVWMRRAAWVPPLRARLRLD